MGLSFPLAAVPCSSFLDGTQTAHRAGSQGQGLNCSFIGANCNPPSSAPLPCPGSPWEVPSSSGPHLGPPSSRDGRLRHHDPSPQSKRHLGRPGLILGGPQGHPAETARLGVGVLVLETAAHPAKLGLLWSPALTVSPSQTPGPLLCPVVPGTWGAQGREAMGQGMGDGGMGLVLTRPAGWARRTTAGRGGPPQSWSRLCCSLCPARCSPPQVRISLELGSPLAGPPPSRRPSPALPHQALQQPLQPRALPQAAELAGESPVRVSRGPAEGTRRGPGGGGGGGGGQGRGGVGAGGRGARGRGLTWGARGARRSPGAAAAAAAVAAAAGPEWPWWAPGRG